MLFSSAHMYPSQLVRVRITARVRVRIRLVRAKVSLAYGTMTWGRVVCKLLKCNPNPNTPTITRVDLDELNATHLSTVTISTRKRSLCSTESY